MEEKEIIKGEKIDIKSLCLGIVIVGFIIGAIYTYYSITSSYFYSNQDFDYIITSAIPFFMSFSFLPFIVVAIIIYFCISKVDIVITNNRVYGKAIFGKRVDLPMDTISAVGTSFLKGIDVGTSAGKIHFKGISNNIEIHAEISKLLNNRQDNKKVNNQEPVKVNSVSTTEELKQYKELLDSGVITQEEFEKKKKQLLEL